MISVCCIHRVC